MSSKMNVFSFTSIVIVAIVIVAKVDVLYTINFWDVGDFTP